MTPLTPLYRSLSQVSVCVQALSSLQAVPSALGGFEHTPVLVLQVPASWHWSSAVQTIGLEPMQVPLWQVSVWVQGLASLHGTPSSFAGAERLAVAGWEVSAGGHR